MKKLLFSIFCVCISIDAFALPTASQRQSACDGVFVKGICVPSNPCLSDNDAFRSSYCDDRFAFFPPRSEDDEYNLVYTYVRNIMGKDIVKHEHPDSNEQYFAVTTSDGDYKVFEFAPFDNTWVRPKYFIAAVGISMGYDCWFANSGDNNTARCYGLMSEDCIAISYLLGEFYGYRPDITEDDNGVYVFSYPEGI